MTTLIEGATGRSEPGAMTQEATRDISHTLRDIGRRLARCRLGKNITQEQLARNSGVSRETVRRVEQGGEGVSVSNFFKICIALGLEDAIDSAMPSRNPGPMEILMLKKPRQRSRGRGGRPESRSKWIWLK